MVDVALDRRKGDNCSTSARVFGPRDGPKQWTHEHLSGSRPLEQSVLDIKVGNDKLDIHDGLLFGSDPRMIMFGNYGHHAA